MDDVGSMVAELIEAGCAPEVAAQVVAKAFVGGVNSGGIPRIPVDSVAEKRRAYDRERKRKSGGIPVESAETPVLHIDTKIKKDSIKQNSVRPSRGTRIDPNWSPCEADRQLAKSEGFSETEIGREAIRFRDYWISRAGAGGVKLDWSATWRNWVRTSAERLGKKPSPSDGGAAASSGFLAKCDSDELRAWDEYTRTTTGKLLPRDRDGHWRVPCQWPPGYQPQKFIPAPELPRLKSMGDLH